MSTLDLRDDFYDFTEGDAGLQLLKEVEAAFLAAKAEAQGASLEPSHTEPVDQKGKEEEERPFRSFVVKLVSTLGPYEFTFTVGEGRAEMNWDFVGDFARSGLKVAIEGQYVVFSTWAPITYDNQVLALQAQISYNRDADLANYGFGFSRPQGQSFTEGLTLDELDPHETVEGTYEMKTKLRGPDGDIIQDIQANPPFKATVEFFRGQFLAAFQEFLKTIKLS